jgi:hypothetical protein
MSDSWMVKDEMVLTVRLEANVTAWDGLQTLDQKNVEYGVISDETGKLFAIVTKEQLKTAETDEPLRALTKDIPHLEAIELDDTFDIIVQVWADNFVFNQDLLGIVVQKQGDVQGILLRKTIVEHALSMLSGRRLAGSPLGPTGSVLFECPIDYERKYIDVDYYDPRNPPVCSNGHKMRRIRE